MRFRGKLALAGLTAAFVIAAAVSTASANRLSVNERNFEIIWRLPLSHGGGGEIRAECAITLRGSFHTTTVVKASRSLIGYINQGGVGTCREGGMTILRETLPWHLQYQSFSGTLPRMLTVTLLAIGASFRVAEEIFGEQCLFRTTAANPSRLIAQLGATGTVEGLRADETATIPMTGGVLCEMAPSNFAGIGTMTRPSAGGILSIRLI